MATDYSQPLQAYDIQVHMVHAERGEYRTYDLTIDATDLGQAKLGAYQIGLGINEASGYQWKLAREAVTAKLAASEQVI